MREIKFVRSYVKDGIEVQVAEIDPANSAEQYWLVRFNSNHSPVRTSTSPLTSWSSVKRIFAKQQVAGKEPTVEEHHCAMFL
jgi:hypothetical protein